MTVPNGAVVGGAKDEVGDQRRPARLVTGVDAPAGVTVEVLVEGQQVVPVPVGLEEAWRRRRPGGGRARRRGRSKPDGGRGRRPGRVRSLVGIGLRALQLVLNARPRRAVQLRDRWTAQTGR